MPIEGFAANDEDFLVTTKLDSSRWLFVKTFLVACVLFCPRCRRGSPRIGMNTFLRPVSVCLCLLCPICLYPLKLKTNILQTTTKISEILHREQPEVHQLQVCIKVTGTNIKISCRKPSSSVDGDLSMQQNGFVHRWWPSKQWFKQTPTYKQCFDPLWNKRSKRNIMEYHIQIQPHSETDMLHPHYVFLASKQYGLTRRWSTPEKRLCGAEMCYLVDECNLPNMKTFPKKARNIKEQKHNSDIHG